MHRFVYYYLHRSTNEKVQGFVFGPQIEYVFHSTDNKRENGLTVAKKRVQTSYSLVSLPIQTDTYTGLVFFDSCTLASSSMTI